MPITQQDRDASWPYRPSCYKEHDYDNWVQGIYDNAASIIQAFAAHRQAALIEGARRMQEAAILKANELYPTMEVTVMLLHLDPTTIAGGE